MKKQMIGSNIPFHKLLVRKDTVALRANATTKKTITCEFI